MTLHHSSGRKFTSEAGGTPAQADPELLEQEVRAKATSLLERLKMNDLDLISAVPGHSSLDEAFVFTPPG